MKKIIASLILSFFVSLLMAQAPQSFNYQGIARNAAGQPLSGQTMNIRLTIHSGTPTGFIEYGEVRTITTNSFGLFSVQVGSAGANATQGSFSTVSWGSEPKYLQTEILLQGDVNYTNLGTVQLQSVPFALHSMEAAGLKFPFEKTASHPEFMLKLTNSSNETNAAAGHFNSNAGYGVYAYSVSGTAVKADSESGTAIESNGGLRFYGGNTNPGNNKVLTSDAFGNASWKENLASGFRLPIDTTINTNNATPLIKIRNINTGNPNAIMQLENKTGPAFYANSEQGVAISVTNSATGNVPAIQAISSGNGSAIFGQASGGNTSSAGVYGDGYNTSVGVMGKSNSGMGVYGNSRDFTGVQGVSTNYYGVYGESTNNHAVVGLSLKAAKAGIAGSTIAAGGIGVSAYGAADAIALDVNGAIKISGATQTPGAGKVLTSDAAGNASWKKPFELKRIGFSARTALATTVAPNTWVRVPFKTEEFDGSDNFTPATAAIPAVFTVPVNGLYHFDTQVAFKDFVDYAVKANIRLVYKRSNVVYEKTIRYGAADKESASPSFGQKVTLSINGDFYFNAGDEVWIEVAQDNELIPDAITLNLAETHECFFSGHLIFEN